MNFNLGGLGCGVTPAPLSQQGPGSMPALSNSLASTQSQSRQTSAAKPAQQPLVTIGIPTFNRAAWLKGCLAATLAQTYNNIEIVVSDNASTDETAAVLEEIRDPRLRVVRQGKNIGAIPNWNACLAEAEGEFIVFVADDDRVKPWMVERCVNLFRGQKSVSLVMALVDLYLVDEDRVLSPPLNPKLATGVWDGPVLLKEFLQGRIATGMCTLMFPTGILRQRGGLPLQWPSAADLAMWLPLLVSGRAGFVNEPCGAFSVHADGHSAKWIVGERLTELRGLVDVIDRAAEDHIQDPIQKNEIRLLGQRYFAVNGLHLVASQRRKGETLQELLSIAWQWRKDFAVLASYEVVFSPRTLALVFCPLPIAAMLRRLARIFRKIGSVQTRERRIHGYSYPEMSAP